MRNATPIGRTRTDAKREVEEILQPSLRTEIFLQLVEDVEGHDAAYTTAIDRQYARSRSRWLQVNHQADGKSANHAFLYDVAVLFARPRSSKPPDAQVAQRVTAFENMLRRAGQAGDAYFGGKQHLARVATPQRRQVVLVLTESPVLLSVPPASVIIF